MDHAPPARQEEPAWRVRGLALLWATALPTLMAVTWPLWTPERDVPRVPALELLGRLPPAIDFLLLAVVVLGAASVLAQRGAAPPWWALAVLLLLLASDQLRWQPWAYHLLLWGAVLAMANHSLSVLLLRWLVVSVYAYAAIAKLDNAFASTLGRQMVGALLRLVGLDADGLTDTVLIPVALALPLAEGAVALLLAVPGARRYGLWLATAMHLSAVLALGPWGLDHQPGVLLWNLVFLAHTWLLFYKSTREPMHLENLWDRVAVAVLALAILGPLTRPLGWWDRWPSWGLYAPGGEVTEVYVHRTAVERLPASLPVANADTDAAWRRVRLDDWMLSQSHAPLYPQRRTTLALALSLQEQARLGDFLQVVLSSPADRFSGERTEETLLGAGAINAYAQRYWLSTRAFSTRR